MRRTCLLIAVLVGACSPEHRETNRVNVPTIAREVERLAKERQLWPGFDPLAIPIAIYDGAQTFMFRHPTPPEGFAQLDGSTPPTYTYPGRHSAVTANSSAEIGGMTVATLMADRPQHGQTETEFAAVVLHESFHVFQRRRHPSWVGNEANLFLYPTDDASLLALRRLESEALRRALADRDPVGAACWARTAMVLRRQRYAGMDSAFSRYERATELNEGLAAYVQTAATGQRRVEFPVGGFRPADVRIRAYTTGAALALLLDRLHSGWAESLESNDRQYLDDLLIASINHRAVDSSDLCGFTTAEETTADRTAHEDVAALLQARVQRRAAFDARSGWRVVVHASRDQPLWPQGFDPLNVERVNGGLLHSRFVQLEADGAQLAAIDGEGADIDALTEGIGPHPLFNGVLRIVVAGLSEPDVRIDSGRVSVRAAGLNANFEGATVHRGRQEVLVRLAAAP